MTLTASAPGSQEALAALQRELASRASVLHFAHFAVSSILGLIAAGTTVKLQWDVELKHETAPFFSPVAIFSGVCFVYGLVRYFYGRRALERELVSFAKLQTLLRELNLEDPSALLPR